MPVSSQQSHMKGGTKIQSMQRGKASRPEKDGGLRASERDFRTFFEVADVGNVIADAETHRFLEVNRRFCEMTGYSVDELRTMTADDLTVPEDLERDQAGWAEARKEDPPSFTIDKRYRRKDGRMIWVQVTSTLVRSPAGEPIHAIGVVRDVTDRQNAIAELEATRAELEDVIARRAVELAATEATARETAHRFETVIENSPLAIVSLDLQGRVLLWNSAAERLFGWKEAEVLGCLTPNIPEQNRCFYEAELRSMLSSPERVHLESKRQHRDGTVFDVALWRAPLFNPDHEIVASIAILMDVTERKFLERALFASTERESRRIGQELHDDLCQHLLGAAFAAKAVTTGTPADFPAAGELNDLAQLINAAVQKARGIARGLNPVELDSAGLMSALQELVDRPHGLACRLECAQTVLLPDAEAALHAYRIAEEAIANAVRHSGGREIVVGLTEDEHHVHLQISDDGRGFSPGAFASNGFGIRLIRYRVHAIGGTVSFDTSKHGGACVNCALLKRK